MKAKIQLPQKRKRGRPSNKDKKINLYDELLVSFTKDMKEIQSGLDFQQSSRGWCYALENRGLNKNEFGWLQSKINEARRIGLLPPGFILEEDGHKVELIDDDDESPEDYIDWNHTRYIDAEETFKDSWKYYDAVSFWEDKEYYIQMLVEKSDLKSLFRKVCEKYKINMACMRGWGSYEQKATLAKNFKLMEKKGHKPVLFACADFDPPGLNISKTLYNWFYDFQLFTGWDSTNLIVERIGLNYDFIKKNKLTWIDNLITIHNKDLGSPDHICHKRNTYDIQGYIKKYGKRKCEANAIVIVPELGREMLNKVITRFIGDDAYDEYEKKIEKGRHEAKKLIDEYMGE